MDRELLLTLNSLWLSVCLNIRLLCRFVCPCVCVRATKYAHANVDCIYAVCMISMWTYTVSMSEYGQKGAYEGRGALTRAYSMCLVCVCLWERKRGRQSVCACRRGSRAGVSALREADVSDVRGKCQSVTPSRVATWQDAHHALFRCMSLPSHNRCVSGVLRLRNDDRRVKLKLF